MKKKTQRNQTRNQKRLLFFLDRSWEWNFRYFIGTLSRYEYSLRCSVRRGRGYYWIQSATTRLTSGWVLRTAICNGNKNQKEECETETDAPQSMGNGIIRN